MSDFEYTKECIIFDLLNISLYHGWLLDPQEEDVATAVHSLSYNQLVEIIIDNKSSADPELVSTYITLRRNFAPSALGTPSPKGKIGLKTNVIR